LCVVWCLNRGLLLFGMLLVIEVRPQPSPPPRPLSYICEVFNVPCNRFLKVKRFNLVKISFRIIGIWTKCNVKYFWEKRYLTIDWHKVVSHVVVLLLLCCSMWFFFRTGCFVIVHLNLTCLHCLQHFSLNIFSVDVNDARSVSLYPYNRSQILQHV